MILYKETNIIVRSNDGDADYLNIVTTILQGVTLTP